MPIYLDNEILTPSPGPDSTVHELIAQLRPELAQNNKMVVSIRCDNEDVPDTQVDEILKRRVDAVGRLDLITASIPHLALGALDEALNVLRDTRQQQTQIVDALSRDDAQQALELLGQCAAAWSLAHDSVLKTVQLLGLNLEGMTYNGAPLLDILNTVNGHLSQLKECLQARDFVLLNDLMQYDIVPHFDQWEGMIKTVAEAISSKTGRDTDPQGTSSDS